MESIPDGAIRQNFQHTLSSFLLLQQIEFTFTFSFAVSRLNWNCRFPFSSCPCCWSTAWQLRCQRSPRRSPSPLASYPSSSPNCSSWKVRWNSIKQNRCYWQFMPVFLRAYSTGATYVLKVRCWGMCWQKLQSGWQPFPNNSGCKR